MNMGRKIVILLFTMFVVRLAMADGNRNFTLVIDAGHGGHDAGALGAMSKEKNINLNVALAFGRYVETNCPDVKVVYTRRHLIVSIKCAGFLRAFLWSIK